MAKRKRSAGINDPGVREVGDGELVIQFTERSTQLVRIAEETDMLFNRYGFADHGVIMPVEEVHRIIGYMEQLRIIADELRSVGK